jgi:hypothetical protein
MTEQDDGGPAFPAHHFDMSDTEHGMTLRDYFAAKLAPAALAAIASRQHQADQDETVPESIARIAYNVADAMLKERAK